MKHQRIVISALFIVLALAILAASSRSTAPPTLSAKAAPASPTADDPTKPASPVKLIFIHHSTGGNWLADQNEEQPYGGLGIALRDNNYFVSATNYGWGPRSDPSDPYTAIGSRTDIVNWPEWFTGPNSSTILNTLYNESGQNVCNPSSPTEECFGTWSRLATDPGGENQIVMFKSCFPNSDLYGNPGDPPGAAPNDYDFSVSNAKAVYNNLLSYFRTRQDKLFVVITAPPLAEGEYTLNDPDQPAAGRAANARAFNNWLVNDWLASNAYTYTNVAVFDYYNVLTSNGIITRTDDPSRNDEVNDLASRPDGNHHYWTGSAVTHTQTVNNDFSAYPSYSGGPDYYDSHPTTAGQQKATAEFVQLLNVFYNRWKSGAPPPPAPSLKLTVPNGGENWQVGSQHQIRWTSTGTIANVSLAYSTDNFSTQHIIQASVANSGAYTWTTPVTPSTSMRLRVASTVSPTTVYDDSDADFTLYEAGVQDHFIYLPVVLKAYVPSTPICRALTGVTISGPTSGSSAARALGGLPARTVQAANSPLPPAAPSARQPSAQPTGLAAFHRSGQTFLTWNEDTVTSGESYHVYRHTAPINASNIDQARRLSAKWGPLPEGSSIFYTDIERGLGGDPYPGLHNYVITDTGPALTDTVGLFVWTTKEPGNFYYAVTSVESSVENRADFGPGNTAGPVAEVVDDPDPILVWQSASGNGRVYTQFMDFETFNPTYERPYAHPDGGLQYAYNYWVGLPTLEQCGGSLPASMPLYLHIEGHGSRYEVYDNSPYWCAVDVWNDDPRQSWYYGFSASYDYRTGDPSTAIPDTGPIVNYSEARLLRSLYDTLRDPAYAAYHLDSQRIFVYGHSMGGSGALALAMRYPNVFAASYSSEPMTNYRTSGDGGGVNWRSECETKWGSVSANLPISIVGRYAGHLAAYNGTGIWDWQNHQANLVNRAGDEMAHISLAHGTLDTVIEWSTQGQPVYQAFYQGRRAFSGATMAADHTWIGFNGVGPSVGDLNYEGPFYNWRVVRDETIPGLTYASGSSSVPPSTTISATYNLNLEWSASWDNWDGSPVDTASQWRISLRTTDDSNQTVDVTPRRVQAFSIVPGAHYHWDNRLVSDDSLVGSGSVTADSNGLLTVPGVAVSPGGNRLSLQPSGGPVPPSLQLTSPNGSEHWLTGSQQQIRWTSTGSVSNVSLSYSTDNFGTQHTIVGSIANTGSYNWTTPLTPSTSMRVRVASTVSPTTVYDDSNADFSLYDASGPTGYVFTATIAPSDATPPITYHWSPEPHSGQGTAVATYQWSTDGVYVISVAATNCGGTVNDTHTITIGSAPPGALDVTLTISNPLSAARSDEPVTSGLPIPRSANLTDLSALRLLDGSGQAIPAQFTPLARWGGAPANNSQPVRWLLLDFQADVPAGGASTYRLVDSGGATPTYPTLNVTDGTDAVTIHTGVAQFSLSKTDGQLTAPRLATPLFGRATSAGGTVYTTTGPVSVTVALDGPMRVSVHVKGSYRDSGGTPLLNYTSRYWFYAGQSTVRLFHTVENNTPCPLDPSGQIACYDIGSAGSVTVTDVSLVLPTNLGGSRSYQAGGASGSLSDELLLYQDSSGTDSWNAFPTKLDWDSLPLDTRPRMQSYISFRGYRTTLGTTVVDSGNQAAGWLSLSGNSGTWSAGVRDFWQNFPKALRASPAGTFEIGLFPDEFGPAGCGFNLRAGEHKTHEILLSPGSLPPLTPMSAIAPPAWYAGSGALGLTALPNWTDWPEHEQYLAYQLSTSPEHVGFDHYFFNLFDAIERSDFYGIFDYGDWPLDYEGFEVAPLNLKYYNDYGMWLQWARGGDSRWFSLAEAATRHTADIDILHTLHSPRHWSDGIAFGHSAHDEDGFINPHRNHAGNHTDTAYGIRGLLLTYYLTGHEKAYASALELADCIEYRLHNDRHLCDYFPGDCSGEGEGLEGSSEGLYENGGRPAANGLSIAAAAYQATADPRYLAVADAVVQWADPSAQPYINGPTGQDQMVKPWMLNLYLRALAEYLEGREEFGLPDTYDARGDFIRYTNWLHTYPWLDLAPLAAGPRAAYPNIWWFDERADNNNPDVNNWALVGADALAYAHHISPTAGYLDWATRLFRAGSHDPFYEGDPSLYTESKQAANSIAYGHTFLHEWARRGGK